MSFSTFAQLVYCFLSGQLFSQMPPVSFSLCEWFSVPMYLFSHVVFPSHILLQFQSYHQFSSLHPISIPAPHLIFSSFENPFQIPPILPRKSNFLPPSMLFNHTFLFPPPIQLGVITSLSEVPTICPPALPVLPFILVCPREIMFGAQNTKAVCFLIGLSPSPSLAQR